MRLFLTEQESAPTGTSLQLEAASCPVPLLAPITCHVSGVFPCRYATVASAVESDF